MSPGFTGPSELSASIDVHPKACVVACDRLLQIAPAVNPIKPGVSTAVCHRGFVPVRSGSNVPESAMVDRHGQDGARHAKFRKATGVAQRAPSPSLSSRPLSSSANRSDRDLALLTAPRASVDADLDLGGQRGPTVLPRWRHVARLRPFDPAQQRLLAPMLQLGGDQLLGLAHAQLARHHVARGEDLLRAFQSGSKARAWPMSRSPAISICCTGSLRLSRRSRLLAALRERPTACAACSCVRPNSSVRRLQACLFQRVEVLALDVLDQRHRRRRLRRAF